MKYHKNKVLLLVLILLSVMSVSADVPPPDNMKRVGNSLIIIVADDVEGFRFFLQSMKQIEEIKVKKGEQSEISSAGRNGVGKFAELIAVRAELADKFSGSEVNIPKLPMQASDKNYIKLASHTFQIDIPKNIKEESVSTIYRIEKDGDTFKVAKEVLNKENKNIKTSENNSANNLDYKSASQENYLGTIIGGILLALGVLFAGIIWFRKSAGKN